MWYWRKCYIPYLSTTWRWSATHWLLCPWGGKIHPQSQSRSPAKSLTPNIHPLYWAFSLLHSMSSEHSPRAKVYKCSNESSSYMKQKVSLPNKLPISAVKKSPCNISYTSYSLNVMNNNIFLKSMWYSDVARKVDNTFLFLSFFFLSLFFTEQIFQNYENNTLILRRWTTKITGYLFCSLYTERFLDQKA